MEKRQQERIKEQKKLEIEQKEKEHKHIMEQKAWEAEKKERETIQKAKERDQDYLLNQLKYEIKMKDATIV